LTGKDPQSVGTVLVITDDEAHRQVLRGVLRRLGCTVLTAVNGRCGVDLYRSAHPDVVLTELLMPDQDGIETLLAVRRERSTAKVIIMSAYHPRFYNLLQQCKHLGACAVLRKPFSADDLAAAIHQCLGLRLPPGPAS
jgi:two-component system chemotaxis response regulator CheY